MKKAIGAFTVTVSKTQILTALNKPEDSILAVTEKAGMNEKEVLVS